MSPNRNEEPTYLTPPPKRPATTFADWCVSVISSTFSAAVEAHILFGIFVVSAFVGAMVWFILFIFRVGFYFPLFAGTFTSVIVFRALIKIKRQVFDDTKI